MPKSRRPQLEPLEQRQMLSITVDSPLDNTTVDDYTTLREAIILANTTTAHDTIEFDPTAFSTEKTITFSPGASELAITEDLTIDGSAVSGLTIDANQQSRVFSVAPSKDATFSALSITGGSTSNGSGIYGNTNSTITVTDSTISGNEASTAGGGIYGYTGCTVTVTDSTISDNTTGYGGGIYGYGSTITANNSTISGNTADRGGGIYGCGNSTITVQANSTISNNTTDRHGGGIYGHIESAITVQTNSAILYNTAHGSGGGIIGYGTVTIDASSISGNTADDHGGGIYIGAGCVATAADSIIALNEAGLYNNIGGTLTGTNENNLTDDNLAREICQAVGMSESGILLRESVAEAVSLTLDSNVVTTLEGLQNADSLESLSLIPFDFSEDAGGLTDTDPLAPLADLTSLEHLTLQRTGLTDADFTNIDSSTDFTNLVSLDLTYNEITAVSSNIADLPALTKLSLHGNTLGTTWWDTIKGKPISIDIPPDHPEDAKTIEDLAEALYYNPIEIYEYVVNTIEFQPYAGSMKGPLATLQTKAGSSWDTASLLAALYEEAGITTKYVAAGVYDVTTKIYVPIEEAMDYLGVTTPKAAVMVLDYAGLNPLVDPNIDNIETIYFDHAWLEADFTDTLGDWVELDPSWKFQQHHDELLDMRDYVSFDTDPATGDYFASPTTQLTSECYETEVRDYLAENMPGMTIADVAYNGPIIAQSFDALPDELPWDIWDIYGSPTDTLTIRDDEVANRLEISIWNDAETVCYVSSDDWAEAGEDHVLVSDVCLSSLAINPFVYGAGIRPTLLKDWDWNNEIQSSTTLNATTNIVIKIDHYEPDESDPEELYSQSYTRTAGDYVVINLDANQISKELVQGAWRDLNESTVYLASQSSPDSYLDDYADMDEHIGQLLQLVGLKFFYDTDEGEELICDLTGGIQQWNRVAAGITTSSTTWQEWWDPSSNYYDTVNYCDLPIPYLPEELKIDIANGWFFATSIDKDSTTYPDDDEEHRNDMLGLVNSAMEHAIWEELTNIDTISTVKSLQLAREDANNEIMEIDSDNIDPEDEENYLIDDLDWGTYTTSIRNSVLSAVNDGYTVWIPKLSTDLGNWTGGGYIIKKDAGGVISIGYIISGALGEYEGGYTTGIPAIPDPKIDLWVSDFTQTHLSDPVNPANGNVYHDETDLIIPNLGTPLEFSRHYKSTQTVGVVIRSRVRLAS